ncbi:MAG: rhodanese-related sulfurtransferase [Candidatus Pelagibacterales bacterium]|nr:MAG: rhodanese-related sulfurtransferase [Pelagibacterales bacterium]
MYFILGFYKFKKISDIKKNKKILQAYFINKKIRGTIIISKEGINGTLSAKKKNLNLTIKKIKKILKFTNFDSINSSMCNYQSFHRGKVKVKKEVVPMGFKITKRKSINHIDPGKWNKLIRDKNTFLLDVRKPFEYEVGTFKSSINPKVDNFRDFPNYLKNLDKNKTIAMFCTGGIRCEKASVFLEKKGFKNVFQLKGGIINYLKKIKKKKSLWKGECYVFDNRVSIKHGLLPGSFSICSGCRKPISSKDKKSNKYEVGVSCPNCHDHLKPSQKERFRMRQKQINLAKKLGKKHIFKKEF